MPPIWTWPPGALIACIGSLSILVLLLAAAGLHWAELEREWKPLIQVCLDALKKKRK